MPVQRQEPAWKLALRAKMPALLLIAVPLVAAGRFDWLRCWFFFALLLAVFGGWSLAVRRMNPGLLRARMEKHEGTKGFDRVILAILLVAFVGMLVVAGLDARFGWSSVSYGWTGLGVLLLAIGTTPIGMAMTTNPFLESTVRIQNDRGQVAITSGPYRVVRHPMYAGALVMLASWPLLLGSPWSYIPMGVAEVTLVIRTALEDRTLQRELAGYAEYAARTRYRLIPGIW